MKIELQQKEEELETRIQQHQQKNEQLLSQNAQCHNQIHSLTENIAGYVHCTRPNYSQHNTTQLTLYNPNKLHSTLDTTRHTNTNWIAD